MTHVRQSTPDSGLDVQAKVHKPFKSFSRRLGKRQRSPSLAVSERYTCVYLSQQIYAPHRFRSLPLTVSNLCPSLFQQQISAPHRFSSSQLGSMLIEAPQNRKRLTPPPLWVLRVGGDEGELRPWHYIYEGRGGRWGPPTMALHIRIQHQE